ncbi:MAG: hypothetical protein AAF514_15185, partial [Verrucomicrobiota bacterium]
RSGPAAVRLRSPARFHGSFPATLGWDQQLLPDEEKHKALNQARLALSGNQIAEAIEISKKAIRQNPKLARGHKILAECHTRNDDLFNAEIALEKAVKARPDWAFLYFQLARNLIAQESPFNVVPTLEKALELEPPFLETRKLLVSFLKSEETDNPKMLKHATILYRTLPDDRESALDLSVAHVNLDQYELALPFSNASRTTRSSTIGQRSPLSRRSPINTTKPA